MPNTFQDKVALVTGAGSGIGREIAEQFAAQGASVVVSDIQEDGGHETVQRIRAQQGRAIFVRADCGVPGDHEAMVAAALREYGALHIAANNAGLLGASAPVGEYPPESWERVIAVNLSGVFYGMRQQIPAMLKAGGGAIVNIASILGQVGFRDACAYVAAKHGVVGLTRNAALEYATKGIRVNSVGPAFIKTPLIEHFLTPEGQRALEARHAMGRLGEPSEVASLALWLCSDQASFVTGGYYAVDGGYLAE